MILTVETLILNKFKYNKNLYNVTYILQQALLCEGGDNNCVTVALFIVWRMLMLKYETEREEDLWYRNNKHDFNCEGGNDSFILQLRCLCFNPF